MYRNIFLKPECKHKIIDISSYEVDEDTLPSLTSVLNTSKRELSFYKSWYLINGFYYYFKSSFAFNELFLSELYKEFNIRTPNYRLAKIGEITGIISHNIRRPESNYLFYDELLSMHGINRISNINDLDVYFSSFLHPSNKDELLDSLVRLLVADFFSGQRERNSYNLLFEEGINYVDLAPITDNGNSLKEVSSDYSSCFHSIVFPKLNTVTPSEYSTLKMIVNNKVFRESLLMCLDLDIDSVLNSTLSKYQITLSKEEYDYIISFFSDKKSIIDKSLCLIRKEN